jgi:hypothetical protein
MAKPVVERATPLRALTAAVSRLVDFGETSRRARPSSDTGERQKRQHIRQRKK